VLWIVLADGRAAEQEDHRQRRLGPKKSPASTQIKGGEGKLRHLINLYVIDEDIRLPGGKTYAFQDGDEITLIPSIASGNR
jgi:molybdopterin converting factor small subunit